MSDDPVLRSLPMPSLYPVNALVGGHLALTAMLWVIYSTATPASPTPFVHAVLTAGVAVVATVVFDAVMSGSARALVEPEPTVE
jgi:hypothetical protein